MAKARLIVEMLDIDNRSPTIELVAFRHPPQQSPYFDTFYENHVARITIKSGETGKMIQYGTLLLSSLVYPLPKALSLSTRPTDHPPSDCWGNASSFTRDQRVFTFEGLVVENLEVDVLARNPFKEKIDMAVHHAKRQVILEDGMYYTHRSPKPQTVDTTA